MWENWKVPVWKQSLCLHHTTTWLWMFHFQKPHFWCLLIPCIPLEENKWIKQITRGFFFFLTPPLLCKLSFMSLLLWWAYCRQAHFFSFSSPLLWDQDGRWHHRLVWSLSPCMMLSAPFSPWSGQETWAAKSTSWVVMRWPVYWNLSLSNWPSDHDY